MRFGLVIHGHHIDAFLSGVGIATLELLERFHAAPSRESAHPRWVVRAARATRKALVQTLLELLPHRDEENGPTVLMCAFSFRD